MEKHPIGDLMTNIVEKVREIADVNTIVGQPIQAGEVTIIPLSQLSVGVGSGGTEFASKNRKPEDDNCFGGGAGAGVNLTPVGFLVVKGDSVKLLPVTAGEPALRHRNVTIWARVQGALGLNVVSVVPWVMPFSTAHSTAS